MVHFFLFFLIEFSLAHTDIKEAHIHKYSNSDEKDFNSTMHYLSHINRDLKKDGFFTGNRIVLLLFIALAVLSFCMCGILRLGRKQFFREVLKFVSCYCLLQYYISKKRDGKKSLKERKEEMMVKMNKIAELNRDEAEIDAEL